MKLKLALFIIGLTLCASWPAFRNLGHEENNEENSLSDFLDGELGEYQNFGDADNNFGDLFDLTFHINGVNGETNLEEENNEEFFPAEPSDEPSDGNNEQPSTPEEPTNGTDTTIPPTNTTNNNTNTTDLYTSLTQDEIQNNPQVQAVLFYGGNQTIQYGYAKKKIPVSIYTITNVISVGKQALSRGRTAYKCSVEIHDPRGILVKAQYTIYVKDSTQEMFVNAWAYQIFNLKYADDPFPTTNTTNNTNNTNTGGNDNNTTPPTNNTNTNNTNTDNTNTGGNDNNTTQPTNNTTNNTQPSTNDTTPTNPTNTTPSDGYVELETSEIESSAEVQGALNYGTNQIIQSGYTKGKIPVSNYTISKINSVERKIQSSSRNAYRCDVEMTGVNKALIKAQFVVYVKVATQEFSIGSWTYNITNIKNNNNNNNSNSNNTTNTANNTNTNTNNNTNTNTSTNTNNTTQPANNTNNNTSTSSYTALSQDEIASNAEVQGALNYGANQTIQYGYTKAKIPVSNYSISKVVSVGKQALSNGRNSYQCDIELLGDNKVVVKAQFVVNVKVATQDKSVSTWSYQVYNLPKGL